MKRYLAWLGILVFISVFVTCQKEKHTHYSPSPAAHSGSTAVAPGDKVNPPSNGKEAQGYSPRWKLAVIYRVFGWPEGVTVWALFLTLITIADQTRHTATAARAALLNAEAVIHSERAWMIAEMNNLAFNYQSIPTPFDIKPVLKNKGQTPAFIVEAASVAVNLLTNESLPRHPYHYPNPTISKWDGKGVPLAPGGGMSIPIPVESPDVQGVLTGSRTLWVFGYVKYNDVFLTQIRETRYCFRWERGQMYFSLDGPEGYNGAT